MAQLRLTAVQPMSTVGAWRSWRAEPLGDDDGGSFVCLALRHEVVVPVYPGLYCVRVRKAGWFPLEAYVDVVSEPETLLNLTQVRDTLYDGTGSGSELPHWVVPVLVDATGYLWTQLLAVYRLGGEAALASLVAAKRGVETKQLSYLELSQHD